MSFLTRISFRNRKGRITIYGIILLEVVAISYVLPSSSSTGEIPVSCANSFPVCDQINFSTSVHNNSTGDVTTLTLPTIQNIINDTIIVTTGSDTGNITTITDSLGDTFTQRIHIWIGLNPFAPSFSVWTTKTSVSGPNIIKLTTDALIIVSSVAAVYHNVASIGNLTSTSSTGGTPSLTMLTAKSGSWITGEMLTSPNNPCPNTVSPSSLFVDRGQACASSLGTVDFEDNATVIRNNLLMTFSPTTSPAIVGYAVGMLELVAIDQAPQNPQFSHFCTDSNGLCITSQYKMNFAVTNSAPTENSVLTAGTAYCSGLTSFSITTSVTHTIFATANFGGNDRNVTGASVLLQLYITTVAPSTTFGAGQCSTSQTQVGETMLNWSTFVGVGASNSQSSTVSGNAGVVAGTYFAYVEITPYNFGTAGHLLWLASPSQPYNLQNIMILEMK